MVKIFFAFVTSAVVETLLACIISTHFALAGLLDIGVKISFMDRLVTTGHDIVSMGPVLGLILSGGMLIGFIIAAQIIRIIGLHTIGYVLAGAVSVWVALNAMSFAFNGITPLAVARTFEGFFSLALAGALAGYIFARLTAKPA